MSSGLPKARTRATRAPAQSNSVMTLLLLAGLVALGPLSTDAYVPGLPELADDLSASPALAQATVTTCLIGLALGQLFAGPLSDAWGRRRPLLIGLVLYVAGGVFCAVSSSVAQLLSARLLQGLGGSFALVVAYACVRDRYDGHAAARYFSLLLLVTGLAPMIAPLAGAQIQIAFGWRGVFSALALLSAALLVAVAWRLDESLPPARRTVNGFHRMHVTYALLVRDGRFVGFALANAFVFGAMFAYIAGSPFVLEELHGLTPQQYSVVFATNALGLVAAAQVSGRLVTWVSPSRLVIVGVGVSLVGGLAMVLATVAEFGLWPLLVAMFAVVASVGLVMPNAAALALDKHGDRAGAAAAILGFGQFAVGGLAAPVAGLHGSSGLTMSLVVAGLGIAAAVSTWCAVRAAPA